MYWASSSNRLAVASCSIIVSGKLHQTSVELNCTTQKLQYYSFIGFSCVLYTYILIFWKLHCGWPSCTEQFTSSSSWRWQLCIHLSASSKLTCLLCFNDWLTVFTNFCHALPARSESTSTYLLTYLHTDVSKYSVTIASCQQRWRINWIHRDILLAAQQSTVGCFGRPITTKQQSVVVLRGTTVLPQAQHHGTIFLWYQYRRFYGTIATAALAPAPEPLQKATAIRQDWNN